VTWPSLSPSLLIFPVLAAGLFVGPPTLAAQSYFETVDVPLVNLDVVVTDRRNRPVTDLQVEDFRVLVDGRHQDVAFFSAPDAPSTTEELSRDPGFLVILFDNNGIEAQERNAIIEQLRQYVAQDLNPDIQLMVASAGISGLEIHQELTHDVHRVDSALAHVAQTATRDRHVADYASLLLEIQRLSGARDPTLRQLRTRAMTLVGQIQAFSDQARQEAEITGSHLWQLVDALAGLPGRRAILFVGGAMSLNPGEALFSALREALTRTADAGAHQVAADLPAGISTGGSDAVEALAQIASVNQVKLDCMIVGGASRTAAIGSSAGSQSTGDSSAIERSDSWAPGAGFQSRMEVETALSTLAAETGGFVHRGRRNLQDAWDRLQRELGGSYSLGFHSAADGDGQVHRVTVEVAGKRLRVRHRQAFRAWSWDQESAARVRSALQFDVKENPLGVQLEARPAEVVQGDHPRVPLTLEIPLSSLALEPFEDAFRGQMSIFTMAGGGRFQATPARKSVLPISLRGRDLQGATGQVAEYRLEVEAPAGTRQIAVGVRDDLGFEFSSLIVDVPETVPARVLPETGSPVGIRSREDGAPLLRLPTAALAMSGQSGGPVAMTLAGTLESVSPGLWRVPLELQLVVPGRLSPDALDLFAFALGEDGRVAASTSQRVRVDAGRIAGEAGAPLTASLSLELPAGGYTIRVVVRDPEGQAFGVNGMEVDIPGPGVGQARWSSLPPTGALIEERETAVPLSEPGGDSQISRATVLEGYRKTLEALAAGDEAGARQILRAMETRALESVSRRAQLDLAKTESRVLMDLAAGSWDRLLPIAVLYGELIAEYRRLRQEPLSEHAMSMSTGLAERMVRKAKDREAKRETADLLVSLAGHLLYLQRLSKTQDLLELSLRLDQRNPWALLASVATLEQRGNYPGALEALEILLAVDPANGEARLRYGVNLARTGREKEAVESLRAVAAGESEEWVQQVAAQELARVLVLQDQLQAAIEVLEDAANRWPGQPSLRVQLAWVLDRRRESARAEEWIKGLADTAALATDSARYRYLQWYEEGLDDLRSDLMAAAVERAANLHRQLQTLRAGEAMR
jgi:VWFA-related protein